MDIYIPNFVGSLRNNSRTTVSSVLSNVKADKTKVTNLIGNLTNYQFNDNFAPPLTTSFSRISKEVFINTFREVDIRTRQNFSAVNTIGLIINSMIDIFSAEINTIEKDIDTLKKFIDNYEYISGKDDLFNSSYMEKFDNYLQDYRSDGSSFVLSDRDGQNFAVNGNAFVDSKTGVMKIGESVSFNNILSYIDSVSINTNYEYIENSDTGFEAVLTETMQDSWSVSVKSPTIVKSNLKELLKYCSYDTSNINGIQASVELSFASPQEIDTLYITPNYSNGLQLLQVVIISEDQDFSIMSEATQSDISSSNTEQFTSKLENNSVGRNVLPVLSSPILIDSITEVNFEKRLCKRVILIFNQASYKRTQNTSDRSELSSRAVHQVAKNIRKNRKYNTDNLQDIVYTLFLQNNTFKNLKNNSRIVNNYYSYKYPSVYDKPMAPYLENVRKEDLVESGLYSQDSNSVIASMFKNFFSQAFDNSGEILEQNIYLENSRMNNQSYNFVSPGFIPLNSTNMYSDNKKQFSEPLVSARTKESVLIDLLKAEKIDQYEYSFSLKSIEFGSVEKQNANKACFVSRKMSFDGHPMAAKLKAQMGKNQIDLNNYNYDLKSPSSIELSISNIEIPSSEEDWITIMNYGSNIVDSEVLFFDGQNFMAITRFAFVPETLTVYKDGYIVDPSEYAVYGNHRIMLEKMSEKSIYCARYQVDTSTFSYDTIDFVKSGLINESIKIASDFGELGERFSSTNALNKVMLKNMPYVNSSYLNGAVYSNNVGTVFSGNNSGYSPVKIVLADGTTVVNLTNYTVSNYNAQFQNSTGYYFIQNGKNIVFNRTINQSFRVFYEYLPDALRFRVVIRENIPNIKYNPTVDSVLVKCKTKLYDPNYDKLTKISLSS
jgi:hypothetical protein